MLGIGLLNGGSKSVNYPSDHTHYFYVFVVLMKYLYDFIFALVKVKLRIWSASQQIFY